ncbi:hypothetical protein ABZ953_24560, partial [Streptomyces sp. NPDC046465]|uniref:hypothetical protein n=1 Tax=Streptomyces sp. NPDC046465 TaxID=3155810 RepID=UPI0033F9408C
MGRWSPGGVGAVDGLSRIHRVAVAGGGRTRRCPPPLPEEGEAGGEVLVLVCVGAGLRQQI